MVYFWWVSELFWPCGIFLMVLELSWPCGIFLMVLELFWPCGIFLMGFRTILTVWYIFDGFRTILTVWYIFDGFRTILTVWYIFDGFQNYSDRVVYFVLFILLIQTEHVYKYLVFASIGYRRSEFMCRKPKLHCSWMCIRCDDGHACLLNCPMYSVFAAIT